MYGNSLTDQVDKIGRGNDFPAKHRNPKDRLALSIFVSFCHTELFKAEKVAICSKYPALTAFDTDAGEEVTEDIS